MASDKHIIITLTITLTLLIVIYVGGRSLITNQSPSHPPLPDDVVWQLDYIISSGETTEIIYKKPKIQFVSEDQIFIGNDGCNSMCGPVEYSTEDGSFNVDYWQKTLLSCKLEILDRENRIISETIETGNRGVLEMIVAAESYELNDNELRLQGEGSQAMIFHSTTDPLYYTLPLDGCIVEIETN
ncbi:MAG: META domain-containing protein [Chloroflexota bacterium]